MINITEYNTKGLIATYLKTYTNLHMFYGGYQDYIDWYKEFKDKHDSNRMVVAFDIETSKLYPIDNKLIMFSIAYKLEGEYMTYAFSTRDWTKEQIILFIRSLNILKSKIVLHNAYFDVTTLSILYGVKPKWNFDTYVIYHNCITHRAKDTEDNDFGAKDTGLSLKDLTRDFLEYGDYESELNEFKKDYCKENKIKISEFTYDLIEDSILAPYNCMDTLCTLQLYEKSLELIKFMEQETDYTKLRSNIKMKHEVTDIYIDSRIRGVKIDRNKVIELNSHYQKVMNDSISKIKTELNEAIQKVERELYFQFLEKELMKDFEYIAEKKPKVTKAGKDKWIEKKVSITDSKIQKIRENCKINLNSSQHKAMLFCDVLGLKPLEVSKKTNSPKCDIKFMEHYVREVPAIQYFLDYGKSRTAINNFLGVNKVTEDEELELGKGDAKTIWELTSNSYPYVHSSYNLNGTVTGRCSCNSINLQQIPSKGVLKDIKKCFCARDNHYLVYADYSSAEVVILGSIIDSHIIHQSLANKWDLHSMNAWKMLKEDILKVHPDWDKRFEECNNNVDKLREFYNDIKKEFEQTVRYRTKSLVFSLAYGTTAHGVSKNLGIPKKEAQDLINKYLDANYEMKTYINQQHSKAKSLGYTENSFGARLLLPDAPNMFSGDRYVKMRAEKQLKKSLNYPIQSANAFLLYEGLIRAKKYIKESGLEGKVHFLFSVYDSFCYEVHESVPKEVVLDILERSFCCYLGDFFLGIDAEIGINWGDTEGIKRERPSKDIVTNYKMKMY